MAPAITLSLFSYPCLMASTSSWFNIGDATNRIVPPLFTKGNKPSAICTNDNDEKNPTALSYLDATFKIGA